MTNQNGANTYKLGLEINTLTASIPTGGGGTAGVMSLSQSGGIALSSSTGNVSIKNIGVTSLSATGNISVSSGTGDITISSNGTSVSSVTGSTGISVSPTTGAVVVTNTGVTSLVAGGGITLSGATGTVTISSSVAPIIPAGVVIDIFGNTNVTISASQLANCYLYSSQRIPSITTPATQYTINLPSYSALVAQYGGFAVIPFTVANFRTTTGQIMFKGDSSTQIVSDFVTGTTQVLTPLIGTTGYVIQNGCFWRGTCVVDPTNTIACYSLNYINNPLFT
jgi:hypothetical protein